MKILSWLTALFVKKKSNSEDLLIIPREKLTEGVILCNEIAKKHNEKAEVLLKMGPEFEEISYVLWTFAMEEYGKGVMLANRKNDEVIKLKRKIFENHEKKFNIARDKLDPRNNLIGGLSVDIDSWNGINKTQILQDQMGGVICVPPASTGRFEDVTRRKGEEYINLRFSTLYIEWHNEGKYWSKKNDLNTEREIRIKSLEQAIELLKKALDQELTA